MRSSRDISETKLFNRRKRIGHKLLILEQRLERRVKKAVDLFRSIYNIVF
jgi:hypothetical protein